MYNSTLEQKTPLRDRKGLTTHTRLKSNTGLVRQKGINPKSDKRKEQDKIYFPLVARLRELCKNRSELSGKNPDSLSDYIVDPHHIGGRIEDRYTDPFNIIMLTRQEHDKEEGKIRGVKPTDPEVLRKLVSEIRIKQGFIPESAYPYTDF